MSVNAFCNYIIHVAHRFSLIGKYLQYFFHHSKCLRGFFLNFIFDPVVICIMTKLWSTLTRKRVYEDVMGRGELVRELNLTSLVALGVGGTLGLGVYIVAGNVAKDIAGPAVCLSFLIAAFACIFSAFCYAELASRVPKAGSAYVYSYVTVGEFFAFIVGWILILESVIGTASAARGLSNYVDSLINNRIRNYFHSTMPMTVPFLSEYPDFFAFSVILLVTIPVCAGIKKSSNINILFTSVNVLTIVIIIIAGSIKADPANWNIPLESIPTMVKHPGTGGFMPFGVNGVFLGAAKCFYGYIGFDAIASVGEEAKNPRKNIPLAIAITLFVVFIGYSSISIVLTMMWPYYDQSSEAPFPHVFEQIGWPAIKWIVNIGAIFAITAGLFMGVLTLPRIFYAMASDGLIFKFFAKVYRKTHTPIIATVVSAFITAMMALLFNLEQLIEMMSIGTLLAYTIVSCCVIILRYQNTGEESDIPLEYMPIKLNSMEEKIKQIFNLNSKMLATNFTSRIANTGVLVFVILSLIFDLTFNDMVFAENTATNIFGYIFLAIIALMIALTIAAIGRQPVSSVIPPYRVPYVPALPCLSIFINLFLMLQLQLNTWLRMFIWVIIGFFMYFFYGIRHSAQGLRDELSEIRHIYASSSNSNGRS